MQEAELSEEPEQRDDDWHARWLTMQSAYAEYRRTSEVLECTRHTSDESVTDDRLRLTMLEGQQRLAFERYMDARIAFLESRFDAFNRCEPDAPIEGAATEVQTGGSRVGTWLSLVTGKPVLQSLAVILLCTMAYSLVREQQRIQHLEAGRDELRTAILRTAEEVQSLGRRLDSTGVSQPQHTPGTPPDPAPRKPAAPPKLPARKPSSASGGTRRGPSAPATAARRSLETESRSPGVRSVSAFSLSPSRELKRLGRISVKLKSIDALKGTASMYIVTDTTQVEVPHLRVNQPVWVKTGHHDHLGLVVNRITANRLEGHVLEPVAGKPDLRASQFRPKADSPQ